MTKADLITQICKQNKNTSKRQASEIVDSCFNLLAKGIKKDKRFSYPGFGTWTMKNRKARKGINPQTGQRITIKASKTCTFKPSAEFKKNLNKGK
jgi:DNA-binding protein HU-beta